jgi:hypothetical protein
MAIKLAFFVITSRWVMLFQSNLIYQMHQNPKDFKNFNFCFTFQIEKSNFDFDFNYFDFD